MRVIDADGLKDIVEYSILANVLADAENTKEEKWNDWIQTVIDRQPTVEAIPKDQYEARLRADMAAMLEELKKEIANIVKEEGGLINKKWADGLHYSEKIIQSKINSLKEGKE